MNVSSQISNSRQTATARTRTPFIGAISGKGGVGKTNLVANLAVAASGLGARVLLVDGDMGLANLDVLLGLVPTRSIADVLSGSVPVDEALVPGPSGLRLLAAASGRPDLCELNAESLACLDTLLQRSASNFDLVFVDIGAGIGSSALALASFCDPVLLVTNAEPTSLADAYTTLKLLHRQSIPGRVELVVNEAISRTDGLRTHSQLARLASRFLAADLPLHGVLPHDSRLVDAVALQKTVVEAFPASPSAQGFVSLAAQLLKRFPKASPKNGGCTDGAFD